jgi:hypothetical protein
MIAKTIDKKNIGRLLVCESFDVDLGLDTGPCHKIYIMFSILSDAPHLNHDLEFDLDLDINHVTLIFTLTMSLDLYLDHEL